MGSGSPTNPDSGSNVTKPSTGSTDQTPCPGTSKPIISPPTSEIMFVAVAGGTMDTLARLSGSSTGMSFANTDTDTSDPGMFPFDESSMASGGITSGVGSLSSLLPEASSTGVSNGSRPKNVAEFTLVGVRRSLSTKISTVMVRTSEMPKTPSLPAKRFVWVEPSNAGVDAVGATAVVVPIGPSTTEIDKAPSSPRNAAPKLLAMSMGSEI